jgi:hypothetical protein
LHISTCTRSPTQGAALHNSLLLFGTHLHISTCTRSPTQGTAPHNSLLLFNIHLHILTCTRSPTNHRGAAHHDVLTVHPSLPMHPSLADRRGLRSPIASSLSPDRPRSHLQQQQQQSPQLNGKPHRWANKSQGRPKSAPPVHALRPYGVPLRTSGEEGQPDLVNAR